MLRGKKQEKRIHPTRRSANTLDATSDINKVRWLEVMKWTIRPPLICAPRSIHTWEGLKQVKAHVTVTCACYYTLRWLPTVQEVFPALQRHVVAIFNTTEVHLRL